MNVNIVKEYPTPFGSDNVVSMRGYSKPSSTSAIETTDTLNTAIGKLEKAIESGGSGNTVSKTRYQISSSSWSSSANSDGFYTLTVSLNPAIGSSPDVYVAGSADGTQPTDTEKGQFAYVKRCKVNGSTLTLYASSKPSSTFYIWVEGVNGTGSGDIVGNVIQPNGASGGESYSTSEQVIGTWTDGSTLYRKVINVGALGNGTTDNPYTTTVSLGISNPQSVLLRKIDAVAYSRVYASGYGGRAFYTLPYTTINAQFNMGFWIEDNLINVRVTSDRTSLDCIVIVEYTK